MNYQNLTERVLNAIYYEAWLNFESDESEESLKIIHHVESELRGRKICLETIK